MNILSGDDFLKTIFSASKVEKSLLARSGNWRHISQTHDLACVRKNQKLSQTLVPKKNNFYLAYSIAGSKEKILGHS